MALQQALDQLLQVLCRLSEIHFEDRKLQKARKKENIQTNSLDVGIAFILWCETAEI